jgi:hypothetical protein
MTFPAMLGLFNLGGGELVVYGLMIPLWISFSIFWIMMMADCVKRRKYLWVAAIALTYLPGALVYYMICWDSERDRT